MLLPTFEWNKAASLTWEGWIKTSLQETNTIMNQDSRNKITVLNHSGNSMPIEGPLFLKRNIGSQVAFVVDGRN